MEMAIPLGIATLMHKTSTVHGTSRQSVLSKVLHVASKKETLVLALYFVSALLMTGGLVVSLSRGGILGLTGSLLLFMVMNRSRRSFRRKTGIIAMTALVVMMTVILAGWDRIESRFEEIGEEGKIKRIEVWSDSMDIMRDFPVLGTGLGTFIRVYPKYQTRSGTILFEHAENDYIEILTDAGIAGFLIVAGLLVAFFVLIVKTWKRRHNSFSVAIAIGGLSSCTAITIHSMTDFNMRIPANALTLTVIAAMTYVTVFHVSSRKNVKDNFQSGKSL